ncbi:MAG: phage tail protein [Ignavibacteriales bacterium]|nr:phage tail protein [Ignavibacteriales bacterium]
MEGTMAEIRMFAGNFAPAYWSFCDGSLLSINAYDALFALLGTMYGGDGRTTFALPDLRGRVPVGTGTGTGLQTVELGELSGNNANTLTINNLPPHNHVAAATVNPAASTGGRGVSAVNTPVNNFPIATNDGNNIYATSSNAQMGPSSVAVNVGVTGSGTSVNNMQPYLGMNYIICIEGTFPSRN